ncbi:hypothetical protein D3C86_2254570 [compost metagenome]
MHALDVAGGQFRRPRLVAEHALQVAGDAVDAMPGVAARAGVHEDVLALLDGLQPRRPLRFR